eukprot:GHVS01012108.1.p1 GENE.GHVS01012108.1~~GHVS01012108.1.p1  ORF type:complete len:147 (-),score=6.87 GHVS01012108.1:380-820(-)
MTDVAVLDALKAKCGNSIRYYDLIEMTYMERAKKVYLAVGKHALYFVKRSLSRVVTGGELYFMYIDKFIEDTNKDTDLKLLLTDNRDSVLWVADSVVLTSVNRASLVCYLNVAYTSDQICVCSLTISISYRAIISKKSNDLKYRPS